MIKTIMQLFGKRSIENPATPLSDPDAWLVDALGGGVASSGIRVTAQTAKTLSTVWRAVNLIARDVAKLPIQVYRNEADGDRNRDTAHPAYRLLKRRPSLGMNAYQFRMTLTARALLTGNAYAMIRRTEGGRPVELVPFEESAVYPVLEHDIATGRRTLRYHVTLSGQTLLLDPNEVLHIRGLGDGYLGESVVGYARDSIGESIAAQRFGSMIFKNGARPSVVLEHPAKLSDKAIKKLRTDWERLHSGSENAHKTAILQEGMQLKPFSFPAQDVEFLGQREFKIRDIANWFGVPPHKLGDTERTSFASLEQENQSYLDDALDPWLVNWEAECYDKLLSDREQRGETHTIEFTRNALVRANLEARGAFYNLGIMGGWLSRDEVRHFENMNRIPDGTGGDFLVPLNMSTAQEEAEEVEEEEQPVEDPGSDDGRTATIEATERVVLDSARRMMLRIGRQATRAAKNPDGFLDWVDQVDEANRRIVEENLAAPIHAARCARGVESRGAGDAIDWFFLAIADTYLRSAEVPREQLELSVEQATEDLDETLSAFTAAALSETTRWNDAH